MATKSRYGDFRYDVYPFIELEGHAWHKSCYKQQHQGPVSNIKPKNPLLSGINKEMSQPNAVKENYVSSAGKLAQFVYLWGFFITKRVCEPVNAAAQDLDAHGTNQAANQTNLSSTSTDKLQPNFDPNSLRPDLIPIYDEILAKHGDIIKNCTLRSKIFKSTYSNGLCSILKDLQTTQVRNFNEYRLSEMLELLADMEKAGFNVEWLNTHLVKIKKFLELNKAYKTLEITRERQAKAVHLLKNSIDLKEEELSKLRSQFWEAKDKYDRIYHEIIVIKSSLDQCPMTTLVDGLL
ncbi:hypothetical protein LguiA_022913 [Lonicera macranthoides]